MIVSRPVPYIIVINPPGFEARWRKFEARLATCKEQLPPIIRIGTNKTQLNFGKGDYPELKDTRRWWVRLKFKLGITYKTVDFAKTYAKHFKEVRIAETPVPGAVACAISHIDAWEHIEKTLNAEQAALIVEDDFFPNLELPFTQLKMPQEADILYFPRGDKGSWSGAPYDDDFLRLTGAWGTHMYAITKQGVQKMRELPPIPLGRGIDRHMFGWPVTGNDGNLDKFNAFVVPKSGYALQISRESSINFEKYGLVRNRLLVKIYLMLNRSKLFRRIYRRYIRRVLKKILELYGI